MEKTKLNLPLPLPLYRGIIAEGIHQGKMIEGSALYSIVDGKDDISIAPSDNEAPIRSIRPETLGMYIGKEDMDGKNVFTGDVLIDNSKFLLRYFLVSYHKEECRFMIHSSTAKSRVRIIKNISTTKIIGNIHENPELLKLFPHLQGG